jgi:hypothetical protein
LAVYEQFGKADKTKKPANAMICRLLARFDIAFRGQAFTMFKPFQRGFGENLRLSKAVRNEVNLMRSNSQIALLYNSSQIEITRLVTLIVTFRYSWRTCLNVSLSYR